MLFSSNKCNAARDSKRCRFSAIPEIDMKYELCKFINAEATELRNFLVSKPKTSG